jgi:hypothetical protein
MTFFTIRKYLCTCGVYFIYASDVAGQPIDPDAITDEDVQRLNEQRVAVLEWIPSPKSLAVQLIKNYEFVVDGHFELPSQEMNSTEDAEISQMRGIVTATFVIDRVIKGRVEDETIAVRLNSDMLDAGDGVSQFQTRQELVNSALAEYKAVEEGLASLRTARDNGEITPEAFSAENARLTRARNEILGGGVISQNRVLPLHSTDDFYTLGGAIAAGEKYLLGLSPNSASPPPYELLEFPISGPNIFWGETREKMLEAL